MKKVYKWLTAKSIRLILLAIVSILSIIFGFKPDIFTDLVDILTRLLIYLLN